MKQWVKHLIEDMPEHLTWTEEPGAVAGDLYVFEWIKHQWREGGEVYRTEVPGLAVRLTAHPVRRRTLRHGIQWSAPYCWVGLDHPVYLDHGGHRSKHGSTSNPARSPDPDAELIAAKPTPAERQANLALAAHRRREQPEEPQRPGRWERENQRKAA